MTLHSLGVERRYGVEYQRHDNHGNVVWKQTIGQRFWQKL